MESKNTFIKLNRKILDWEWYKDANTFKLFIHLLLTANVKDKKWQGIIVKRGELITSVKSLTQQTGLTTFQVRRALDNLITTNTATKKTTNKYTVISILNYEKYQAYSKQDNKRTTNEQQTNNKRTTTTKEYKEYIKNDNNVVEVGADAPFSDHDRLEPFGNLLLSENQVNHLLNLMGKDTFDDYCARLEQYIYNNDAFVKSHYATMLKWYKEDCAVEGKNGETNGP